jgi:hypothetical protein
VGDAQAPSVANTTGTTADTTRRRWIRDIGGLLKKGVPQGACLEEGPQSADSAGSGRERPRLRPVWLRSPWSGRCIAERAGTALSRGRPLTTSNAAHSNQDGVASTPGHLSVLNVLECTAPLRALIRH